MLRMNSDKKNRMIQINCDENNGILISITIHCNYNVVITTPTFNFPFTLFTKIRNRKCYEKNPKPEFTKKGYVCVSNVYKSWLQNMQSQQTSFQKLMPKMWKACLLQSHFANRTRMPKAAAR